jgi:hypothetical protein
MKVVHHWRWRSPKHLLTCGARNGQIYAYKPGWDVVTCLSCIRVGKSRGWLSPATAKRGGEVSEDKYCSEHGPDCPYFDGAKEANQLRQQLAEARGEIERLKGPNPYDPGREQLVADLFEEHDQLREALAVASSVIKCEDVTVIPYQESLECGKCASCEALAEIKDVSAK